MDTTASSDDQEEEPPSSSSSSSNLHPNFFKKQGEWQGCNQIMAYQGPKFKPPKPKELNGFVDKFKSITPYQGFKFKPPKPESNVKLRKTAQNWDLTQKTLGQQQKCYQLQEQQQHNCCNLQKQQLNNQKLLLNGKNQKINQTMKNVNYFTTINIVSDNNNVNLRNGKEVNLTPQISETKSIETSDNQDSSDQSQEYFYAQSAGTRKKIIKHIELFIDKLDIEYDRSKLLKDQIQILNKLSYKIQFLFKGKPYKALATAIIIFVCRKHCLPVTTRKIIKVCKTKFKMVSKCMQILKREVPEQTCYISKPQHFLENISKKLLLHASTIELSKQIISRIQECKSIRSVHPKTIASCSIFIASLIDKNCNQNMEFYNLEEKLLKWLSFKKLNIIANASEMSKTTIRTLYDDLLEHKQDLLRNLVKCDMIESMPLL